MNILVVAAYGLYEDYKVSFVHNQIKEYAAAGHRVRAVVPVAVGKKSGEFGRISSPVASVIHDGVEICYVRCLSLGGRGEHTFNPAAAEKSVCVNMGRILKDFRPDVIHAHGILFGGRIGANFKEHCGVPLVITTHGGDTDVSLTAEQNKRARQICDKADLIVAVSPLYREKTLKIGSKTQALCILNGFNSHNTVEREKRAYSIIQVGSLIKRKHTDLTLRAFVRLVKDYPTLTLTLVGSGEEREGLEKLANELCIQNYVNFTGFLSNTEAMERMAESEIFILPSTEEGFGIVYLEAMASGCVTIGTKGEGIDGVIENGVNGYLVKPNDVDSILNTLRFCLENPKDTHNAAQKGTETAKKLTWERNAAEYLRIFDSLIK